MPTKFIIMHKADAVSEGEPKPTQELLANVGRLVKGAIDSGRLIDAAGLRASRHRVRVTLAGGQHAVKRGPYAGERELFSELALLRVKSLDDAVAWGARYARAAGASEVELGTVTEPWDLGVVPKPEGEQPVQVLALLKANARSEAGAAPTAERDAFLAEAQSARVLQRVHALLPSATAARVRGGKGARQVVDGPFSESKELVGGFMIMTFESRAEAVAFAKEYADIVGTPEVDVREVR